MEQDVSTCLGIKYFSKVATGIKLSDIYAVELNDHGSIHISSLSPATECLFLGQDIKVCSCSWLCNFVPYRFIMFHSIYLTIMQMYSFTVHGFIRNKNQPSQCILVEYTFGHKNLPTCQMWVNQLNASLKHEVGRPKNLLVCSSIGQTFIFFLFLLMIN